jgi:hypothetical protein
MANRKDGVAALRHIIYFKILQKPSAYFKPGMPAKYIPQGS